MWARKRVGTIVFDGGVLGVPKETFFDCCYIRSPGVVVNSALLLVNACLEMNVQI